MYSLIDDKNRSLPRHITEEQYLVLPLSMKVLYMLEGDEMRNFVAGDGEPAGILPDSTGSFDVNDIEPEQDLDNDQLFP